MNGFQEQPKNLKLVQSVVLPTGIDQDERKKKCSKCKNKKLHSEFQNDKSRVDGKSYICKVCSSLKSKKYHHNNKKSESDRSKKFYQDNKEAINLYRNNRYKNNPYNKIETNLRKKVSKIVRKIKEGGSPDTSILGCTKDKFVNHIESMFKHGMNWGNHDIKGWHIDHVKPISSFDLTDPEQIKLCFNYTNTQPLWCLENLAKGDRYHE